MDNILEPNSDFDFSKLSLGPPQSIKGGSYFTRLSCDGQDVYVQFPKCKTKQGITQTEKKYQCDLLYETVHDGTLNDWLESLETNCQKLIYQKRNTWFNNDIDLNDIETAFNGCARLYKSGRQFLIRCHIIKPTNGRQTGCNVYDEDESMLSFADIDNTKDIIPLIKLDGIKFSTKNFQIELNISQIMVLKEKPEIKQCLIKLNNNKIDSNNKQSHVNANDNVISVIDTNDEGSNKIVLDKNKTNEEIIDLSFYAKDESSNEDSSDEDTGESLEEFEEIARNQQNTNNNECKDVKNKTLEKIEANKGLSENTLEKPPDNNLDNKINALDIPIKTDTTGLELIDFDFNEVTDTVKLKNPNEVYYEIYKQAREKAKLAKKLAIEAYLDAQNIKTKYMLDDLDESDDDENNH